MKKRLLKKLKSHPIDSKGRTVFINDRTGRRQVCRLDSYETDPIMDSSSCEGEFLADFARKDRWDGCPSCREERA